MKFINKICFFGIMIGLLWILVACREDSTSMESDNNDEPYIIAIENLTLGQEYEDTEVVEEAVNAIIMPLIHCQIDIVNYHIADHATKVTLAIAGGEKLDLINTGLTTNIVSFVADGTVIPLENLLDQYAPLLLEKEGDLLEATTIDGHIYAIPSSLYTSKANGLGFNEALLENNGLALPETIDLESLTKLGKELKEKDPTAYLLDNADGSLSLFDVLNFSEVFDVHYSQGVIINPIYNTKIVNAYDTHAYSDYIHAIRTWYEMGLMPEMALTSGLTGQDLFNKGNVLMQQMNISPVAQQIVNKKGLDFEETLVATTPVVSSLSSIREYAWGITTTCEQPEKVMEFLELLYNNPDIANLLNHGIEGIHYEMFADDIIRYPEGVDGENVGYGRIFSMYGDAYETYQFGSEEVDYHDQLIEFESEAKDLLTLGYFFESRDVASRITAVNDVVNEFRPLLESGVIEDVDGALEAFRSALDEAGIDIIIEANQKQLDQWLERSQ